MKLSGYTVFIVTDNNWSTLAVCSSEEAAYQCAVENDLGIETVPAGWFDDNSILELNVRRGHISNWALDWDYERDAKLSVLRPNLHENNLDVYHRDCEKG